MTDNVYLSPPDPPPADLPAPHPDNPVSAPLPAPPGMNWGGFLVGVVVGIAIAILFWKFR
jgi:hypothetical protein